MNKKGMSLKIEKVCERLTSKGYKVITITENFTQKLENFSFLEEYSI